jgi:hypothetical protein
MVYVTVWNVLDVERMAAAILTAPDGVIEILPHGRFQERQAEMIVEQRAEVFLPHFAPRAARLKKIHEAVFLLEIEVVRNGMQI